MRLLPKILLVALLFMATTFAGMAFFGMGMGAVHMDHGVAATNCLNHCIDEVAPSTTLPAALAVPFLFLLAFCLLATVAPMLDRTVAPVRRWAEGIGKYLRHQRLSVIVLRN